MIIFSDEKEQSPPKKVQRQSNSITSTSNYWTTTWKNAFQGEFYEAKDSRGHSSLHTLDYLARSYLFLSLCSSSILLPSNSTERPMFNYLLIVQSSGTCKSRLLRELGKSLPLIYANLRPGGIYLYPLQNNCL